MKTAERERRQQLFFQAGAQDNATIQIPEGKMARIVSIEFQWTNGAGLQSDEGCLIRCGNSSLIVWGVIQPLVKADGTMWAIAEYTGNPFFIRAQDLATGVLTAMLLRQSAGIPNIWIRDTTIFVRVTFNTTAVMSNLQICYELSDQD